MDEKTKDSLKRRCPRLGGPVTFGYCKTAGEKLPQCHKIFDCWWEYFDVFTYLKSVLPEDEFNALRQKPGPEPKLASIVELIARAKQRTKHGGKDDNR